MDDAFPEGCGKSRVVNPAKAREAKSTVFDNQ